MKLKHQTPVDYSCAMIYFIEVMLCTGYLENLPYFLLKYINVSFRNRLSNQITEALFKTTVQGWDMGFISCVIYFLNVFTGQYICSCFHKYWLKSISCADQASSNSVILLNGIEVFIVSKINSPIELWKQYLLSRWCFVLSTHVRYLVHCHRGAKKPQNIHV